MGLRGDRQAAERRAGLAIIRTAFMDPFPRFAQVQPTFQMFVKSIDVDFGRNNRQPTNFQAGVQMKKAHNNSPAKSRRRGASAVEFAVVAPIFFLFVFGLVEFGRMVMVRQSVTNAAREGCREATLATTISRANVEATVRSYLQDVISGASNPGVVRVGINAGGSASGDLILLASGTPITVDVEVDFANISWVPVNILSVIGAPVISADSTQNRE